MNEIVIDEKKYVSSKRAAEITGYAKDYIGQLCREGRIPARLVGRAWYTLESALKDHRFGSESDKHAAPEEPVSSPSFSSTWDSPRYMSIEGEEIPSINKLKDIQPAISSSIEEEIPIEANFEAHSEDDGLKNTWQEWFSGTKMPMVPIQEATEPDESPVHSTENDDKGEEVHIRAIHHPTLGEKRGLRPISSVQEPIHLPEESSQPQKEEVSKVGFIRVGAVAISLLTLVIGILGTGYVDKYLYSNKQVSMVAGIEVYNK